MRAPIKSNKLNSGTKKTYFKIFQNKSLYSTNGIHKKLSFTSLNFLGIFFKNNEKLE